MGGGTA